MKYSMEVALLSFVSICAGETFNLSNTEMASIGSAVFGGQIIGSFFWGPLGKYFLYTIS